MVDWLSDHLLVGRSQKENAADLRELLVTFLSKMTLYRRRRRATLWCMCATALRAGSRSFRAGSRITLSFQYGSLVRNGDASGAGIEPRHGDCHGVAVAVLPRGCYPTNNKPPEKLARFSTGKSGALHNDFAVAFFNVCVICFKLLQLARERTWTL